MFSQIGFAEFSDELNGDEFEKEFEEEDIKHEFKRLEEEGLGKYEFRRRAEIRYGDFGPSYEGHDKEMMLFGRVFMHIRDEMDPTNIKQYCDNPNEMADIVISKLKEKIGDVANVCIEIEEQDRECKENIKVSCSQISQPDLRYAIDEMDKLEILANSCPINKDAIIKACVLRLEENMQDRFDIMEYNCDYQWESYGKKDRENCERMKRDILCDEDEYINNCMDAFGVKPDSEKSLCGNNVCEVGESVENCNVDCKEVRPEHRECLAIYEPVCGSNGVTYSNECEANKRGVTYTYGECKCYSEEEVERMVNNCINSNGNPEKIYYGGCVVDTKCTPLTPTGGGSVAPSDSCTKYYTCPDGTKVKECELITELNSAGCRCKSDPASLCPIPSTGGGGGGIAISGGAVLETYDDYLNECERQWKYQEDTCNRLPKDCGKDSFVEECIQREKENYELELSRIDKQCEIDSKAHIRHMERQCTRIDIEKQRCLDNGMEQCERIQGLVSECREKISEESFRKFIIREAEKRCKFIKFIPSVKEKGEDFSKYKNMEVILVVLDTVTEEDISKLKSFIEGLHKKLELDGKIIFEGLIRPNDFVELKELDFVVDAKLNALESFEVAKQRKAEIISINPQKVVEKLLEISEIDVSGEYKYLIEDEASDILEVSDDLEEIAEKEKGRGFGYKIRLFLGLAKKIEEDETKRLEMSKQRLETSIASLSKLAEEVPDDIAKAILKAQVEELQRQKEDMDSLIEQKQKRSNGILQLFGLFG